MHRRTLPLFALTLFLLIAPHAHAEGLQGAASPDTPPAATAPANGGAPFLDEGRMNDLEKMSPDDREAFSSSAASSSKA